MQKVKDRFVNESTSLVQWACTVTDSKGLKYGYNNLHLQVYSAVVEESDSQICDETLAMDMTDMQEFNLSFLKKVTDLLKIIICPVVNF